MIYTKGQAVWQIDDDREIKEKIIEDARFITWLQELKIDDKWQAADSFYPSLDAAEEALAHKYIPRRSM